MGGGNGGGVRVDGGGGGEGGGNEGGGVDVQLSPVRVTPDPRLPLTPMQVFKLKKNWKGVKRRLEDTGVEMLIR